MHLINPYSEEYRVFLLGVGQDSDEEKEFFCCRLSEKFNIPPALLKKIVDHCPMILKRNLTWKAAESLVKTLRSYGARILIETRKNLPPLSLEFQSLEPLQLALESSSFGKTQSGIWNVVGRVRNITSGSMGDAWVLIQLFDSREEFLTFEEVPLTLNPLPPGEISPFKAVFEKDIAVHKVSIGFKTSSGAPLGTVDRRPAPEWKEVKWDEGDEAVLSIDLSIPPRPSRVEKPIEEAKNETLDQPPENLSSPKEESPGRGEEPSEEIKKIGDNISKEPSLENAAPMLDQPASTEEKPTSSFEAETVTISSPPAPLPEPLHLDAAPSSLFSWIEEFRNSIEHFYQTHPDPFLQWFRSRQSENKFKDDSHSVLTLLAHARFDEMNETERALKNTESVFQFLAGPQVLLDEIPVLEGTLFFSQDQWRELFYRAVPKLQQISRSILGNRKGEAFEIQRMILVIPHMSERMSRKAVRWLAELLPQATMTIDFSNYPVSIDRSLYRVASRLGIVNPHFDFYQGINSMADFKIQAFARSAFPQDPSRIEAPMAWIGGDGAEGRCLPSQPGCTACPFGRFCQKLYLQFDPSEKGMGRH